jgi:hypothetical protein
MPMMDSAVLMALVDRWRPKTHMFHLPSGEIMVTLQDIVMIIGLPIDGTPVCGSVSPGGWRDSVGAAINLRPPDVPAYQKDKKSLGIHSRWLTAHFNTCPEGAEDGVVQRYAQSCLPTYFLVLGIWIMSDCFLIIFTFFVFRYARAWLWHMVVGFLFSDRSGNTIS